MTTDAREDSATQPGMSADPYQAPRVTDLGDLRTMTLGVPGVAAPDLMLAGSQ